MLRVHMKKVELESQQSFVESEIKSSKKHVNVRNKFLDYLNAYVTKLFQVEIGSERFLLLNTFAWLAGLTF